MKRELQIITMLGYGILVGGFCILSWLENGRTAGQWLIQTSILWGYVCRFTWQRLSLNRADMNTPLYPKLGLGNRLTLLRGGLIALTGGFLFNALHNSYVILLPAALYTLAAILDRLDGFAARRSRQVSLLGNELDINFDALGLVVAPLLAINRGEVHGSYLILSVAYYLYRWLLQHRQKQGHPIYPLAPTTLRRTLAGFQMGFIATALWSIINPALTTIASIAFMLPVLFGFVMDWWVISGSIPSAFYNSLEQWSKNSFQPGLRVLLILLFLITQSTSPINLTNTTDWLIIFSLCLIALGCAGRLAALVLMLLYHGSFTHLIDYALIFTLSWIMLLGTGRYSLWQKDDEIITRHEGA